MSECHVPQIGNFSSTEYFVKREKIKANCFFGCVKGKASGRWYIIWTKKQQAKLFFRRYKIHFMVLAFPTLEVKYLIVAKIDSWIIPRTTTLVL